MAQFPPRLQTIAMQVAVPCAIAVAQEHHAREVGAQKSRNTVIALHNVYVSNISLEESHSSGDPVVRLSWGIGFSVYFCQ